MVLEGKETKKQKTGVTLRETFTGELEKGSGGKSTKVWSKEGFRLITGENSRRIKAVNCFLTSGDGSLKRSTGGWSYGYLRELKERSSGRSSFVFIGPSLSNQGQEKTRKDRLRRTGSTKKRGD